LSAHSSDPSGSVVYQPPRGDLAAIVGVTLRAKITELLSKVIDAHIPIAPARGRCGANALVPLLAVAANLMRHVYRNISKTIQFGNVYSVLSCPSCSGLPYSSVPRPLIPSILGPDYEANGLMSTMSLVPTWEGRSAADSGSVDDASWIPCGAAARARGTAPHDAAVNTCTRRRAPGGADRKSGPEALSPRRRQTAHKSIDRTVDSQITSLRASGADVLLTAAIPRTVAQTIRKVYEISRKPLHHDLCGGEHPRGSQARGTAEIRGPLLGGLGKAAG
jgi:hypothetical protein